MTVLRAALLRLRTKHLVAVCVVDRHDDEHHRVEYVRFRIEQQITQHRLHRLFALDLTRVDVALDVHDRPAKSLGLERRGHQRP